MMRPHLFWGGISPLRFLLLSHYNGGELNIIGGAENIFKMIFETQEQCVFPGTMCLLLG